jgi:glycosyltransferase involved in cell wall biosynthesis
MDSKLCPLALLRLYRQVRRRSPDILHSFLFHANVLGRIAGRLAGVPHVISAVRVAEPRSPHLAWERLTHWLVDAETCVSKHLARYTRQRCGVPEKKLVVIPNGIEIPAHSGGEPPRELAELAGSELILMIGRLDEQKDPITFVEAAIRLLSIRPNARFALIGSGPLEESVRHRIEKLGLTSRFRMVPWLDDVRPALAMCKVLVVPSRWEGMPNVVLEAMAAAKPVVATSVGGTPELVEHEATGFLVPTGQPDLIAYWVGRLLQSPERASRMGKAGFERARIHFPIENMVDLNQKLYERLLHHK